MIDSWAVTRWVFKASEIILDHGCGTAGWLCTGNVIRLCFVSVLSRGKKMK